MIWPRSVWAVACVATTTLRTRAWRWLAYGPDGAQR